MNIPVHIRVKPRSLTELEVRPEFVKIYFMRLDEVVWRGHGGKIAISFIGKKKQGTPFVASNFSAPDETDCASGPAQVRPPGGGTRRYNYLVTMTLRSGRVLKVDPGVDVDGGGPPGGGLAPDPGNPGLGGAPYLKTATRKTRTLARKKVVKKKSAQKKASLKARRRTK